MARTISDEELQLKRRARRRLIGAVVLVTAMVVVLPMVLDSEPKPVARDIAVQIPSADSGPFAGQIAPLPAQKNSKAPAKGADSAPPPAGETKLSAATPPQEAQTAEKAKPAVVKKEAVKPKPKPKPKAKADGGRFVVQVIALADADRARQMQERIAAAGVKSYTEVVKTAKGDVTRVRAGPFATREAAEKAREQLKSLGMSGNVTSR